MSDQSRGPVLVIGGNGKTGRRIVERLWAGSIPVRIGSRSGEPPFDWTRPETWPAALEGASAAYVSFHPDLALPGAAEAVEALARMAGDAGIGRLVLLSGRGEAGAQRAERAVRAVVPQATLLRASWFCQNFSESLMLEGVLDGEIALPAGEVPEPFVDTEDIADAAVAALTRDDHAGQLYELTGPRAITFADAVAEIARASGRAIRYRTIPLDAFLDGLTAQGAPEEVRMLLEMLFGEVFDGRNRHPADGVQRALSREPGSFADYARRTAATGIWQARSA